MSIVVPVLNETATINACIGRVRQIEDGARCEVIVVDGDARGGTIAVVDDPGVVRLVANRGRGAQMNAGAVRANGDVLVFLHADTVLPNTAFRDIAGALADPCCVGGAFAHRFDSPRLIYRAMSAVLTRVTRWNRRPYGDQALFFRRGYFDAVGGFAPIAVMEDVELVRRIRVRGGRLRVLRSEVRTSCRRLEREGVFRRVIKNAFMTLLFDAGVSPGRLARHYRPHGGNAPSRSSRVESDPGTAPELTAGVAIAPPGDTS